MSWISLVCLLALSSSAFGRSTYGSSYGDSAVPTEHVELSLPKTFESSGYGAAPAPRVEILKPKLVEGYGSAPAPRTFDNYGAAPAPRVEILKPKLVEGYGSAPAPRLISTPRFTSGYGAAPAPRTFDSYGAAPAPRLISTPRFTSGYGSAPALRTFDSYGAAPAPRVEILKPKLVEGYGAAPAPRVISGGYGSESMSPISFSEPIPAVVIKTEADLMCQGKFPETVILIGDGQRYVVCTDDTKGDELFCPKGLYYSLEKRQCDYRPGSMPDACASNPCLNGGQCNSFGSSFECICASGFDGKTCEFDARVCQTQSPCGDGFCQSFRPGAALSYVCIFQGGAGYGFSTSQIQPSPCNGFDGTLGLGISNRGFIMCDNDKLSIESCPGGTIWNDIDKACSWPEMEVAPATSFEQRTFVQGNGYGAEAPRVVVETPKITFNREFITPSSGY